MSAAGSRQWHKLLGLSVGSLLLLVILSGGILIFKGELIALSVQGSGQVPDYRIEHIASGMQHILQRHSVDELFYIKTPTQGRHYWWVALKDEQIYLYDALSHEALEDRWRVLPVLHWLQHFHTELLLPSYSSTGITLLGVGALLIMLLGLISWWPGRSGFRWRHLLLWPKRRGPALRQHRAVALLCLPLLILSVVTGGGMSVQGALRDWLAPEAEEPISKPALTSAPKVDPEQLTYWLQYAQQQVPDSEITMLSLRNNDGLQLGLRFRAPGEWHVNGKTSLLLNMDTGDYTLRSIEDASTGRQVLNTFYPLHTGYGLNGFYRSVVIVTALLSTTLALLGFIAWGKRRRGNQ